MDFPNQFINVHVDGNVAKLVQANVTVLFVKFWRFESVPEVFRLCFISSSRFLLRPNDVTTTSNLLFVHSFMQFQLNCVRDVIFRS